MAGQLNQPNKGSNRKLVLVFIGLIIIGIVCMKLKKTEQYEEDKKKPNAATAAYDQLKNTFSF